MKSVRLTPDYSPPIAGPETTRERNVRIAAYVGAVLLPLAGLIGAWLFYARGERATASSVLGFAFVGITIYLIAFGGA